MQTVAKKRLIDAALGSSMVEKVYLFSRNNTEHVWIVVREVSAEIEYQFSKYYAQYINELNGEYCDFMVLSQDELEALGMNESSVRESRLHAVSVFLGT